MTEDLRKGWCPGALRPMMARDGLLVRLRVTGGILIADQAGKLATLATRYGNGSFDLSARGNLQIRGVSPHSLPDLQLGLAELGLIDQEADGEAVRNVIASPMAGLCSWLDIRPLVARLERAIVADEACRRLPGKFCFLIDDGSEPSLRDIEADLRFEWLQERAVFSIGIGGTGASAIRIADCLTQDLVRRAIDLAGVAAKLLVESDRSRLRHLVSARGRTGIMQAFHGEQQPAAHNKTPLDPRGWVGRNQTIQRTSLLGLAAPFGRISAAMLTLAAACAAMTPMKELRLTPWRMILIPGAEGVDTGAGFIVDRRDPRLTVAACVGAEGCTRGSTPTHEHAARLASFAANATGEIRLHVSGCAKGCAKPSRSALTIVAEDGTYGLIRHGRASDQPVASRLSFSEVAALLREGA